MQLETISAMRFEDKKLYKLEITSGVDLELSRIVRASDIGESASAYEIQLAELAAALIVYKLIDIKREDYKDALDIVASKYSLVVLEAGDKYEQIGPLAPAASLTEE